MRSRFVITASFIVTLLVSGTFAVGDTIKEQREPSTQSVPGVSKDDKISGSAIPNNENPAPQIDNTFGLGSPPEPSARNTINKPFDSSGNEKDLIPIWLSILLIIVLFLQTAFFYICITKHSNAILQALARISNKVSSPVSNIHSASDSVTSNFKEIINKLNSHVDNTDRVSNETNQRIDKLQHYLQQTNAARPKAVMDESLKRGLTTQQTQSKSNAVISEAQDKHIYVDAEQLGVRFLHAMKECDWKFDKAWERFIAALDFPIKFETFYYDLQSSLINDLQLSKPDNWLNPVACRLLWLPSINSKAVYLFNSLLCEYCPGEQDFRFCNVIKADPNFSRDRLVRCRPPTIILRSNVWQASEKGEIVYQ